MAVAAIAAKSQFLSVGVDIEPAEPLEPGLLEIIATARERERAPYDPFRGRLLFSIKEAIYKAVYPLDGVFLDHHDVEVTLTMALRGPAGAAGSLPLLSCGHIVVLAFIPGRSSGYLKAGTAF